MSILRRGTLSILRVVSARVSQKKIFEKKGERKKQRPLELVPPKVESVEIGIPSTECLIATALQIQNLLAEPGQWLLVNHWATWCEPCIEEFPVLKEMNEQLADFTLVGVSWDLFEGGQPATTADRVADFSQQHNLGYGSWLVVDPPDSFFQNMQVEYRKIPQTWVVSPSGKRLLTIEGLVTKQHISQIRQIQQSHNPS